MNVSFFDILKEHTGIIDEVNDTLQDLSISFKTTGNLQMYQILNRLANKLFLSCENLNEEYAKEIAEYVNRSV